MRRLGKYLLVEPIASGGMAEVWRAEVAGPAGFVKQVALKLVRADRGDDDALVEMFIREARMASSLHHAGIVHVFDFDHVDGRYLIAMELVHGRSLRAVLDRCREAGVRFGLARSVHVGMAVARALAYAHRPVGDGGVAGLVHRDVSPHNVLVSFEGEVKLTDFGIARAADAGGLTSPGTLKGKVAYMAPEQARGEAVDGRADLFALGAVLWELCAGRRLFARDSEAATLRALTGDAPISPPSAWNEEVPPALDALVLGALARDPERRTRTADELAAGLAEVSLGLARAGGDGDLRPLMRRLWHGESPARPTPAPAGAPPVPGGGRVGESALEPEASGDGAGGAGRTRTATTQTWRDGRSWTLRVTAVAVGAAVAVALAAAGASSLRRRGGPNLPLAAAAHPFPDPTGTPAAGSQPVAQPPPARLPDEEGASRRSLAPDATGEVAGGSPQVAAGRQVAGDTHPPARRPVGTGSARRPPPVVREASDRLGGLALPPPESREGILFLNAVPWAQVTVDGVEAGETPLELRLAAGRHHVRLEHPTLGGAEETVRVPAGRRVRLERPLPR